MIDLHIHTTYSDGADSLIDVLKKAEEKGLSYISITDHDNCNAYKELKNIDEIFSSSYSRAISTAKYIAEENNIDIIIDKNLNERKLRRSRRIKKIRKE